MRFWRLGIMSVLAGAGVLVWVPAPEISAVPGPPVTTQPVTIGFRCTYGDFTFDDWSTVQVTHPTSVGPGDQFDIVANFSNGPRTGPLDPSPSVLYTGATSFTLTGGGATGTGGPVVASGAVAIPFGNLSKGMPITQIPPLTLRVTAGSAGAVTARLQTVVVAWTVYAWAGGPALETLRCVCVPKQDLDITIPIDGGGSSTTSSPSTLPPPPSSTTTTASPTSTTAPPPPSTTTTTTAPPPPSTTTTTTAPPPPSTTTTTTTAVPPPSTTSTTTAPPPPSTTTTTTTAPPPPSTTTTTTAPPSVREETTTTVVGSTSTIPPATGSTDVPPGSDPPPPSDVPPDPYEDGVTLDGVPVSVEEATTSRPSSALAFTGAGAWPSAIGLALVAIGSTLMVIGRRRAA